MSKEVQALDIQFVQHDAVNPGSFSGLLDYFDLDTDIQLPKQVFNNATDYRALIKDLAQIYVYRNGFGIRMPNDWLKLGSAWTSQAGYYSLKPSNVIGFFGISVDENSQLVEKSDREGFTDNDAWRGFSTLTTIITNSVNGALNRFGKTSAQFLNEATGVHASEEESSTNYGELINQLENLLKSSETLSQHFGQHAKSRLYGLRKVEGEARLLFINLKESDEKRAKAKQLLEAVERLQEELASDNSEVEKLTTELAGQKQL